MRDFSATSRLHLERFFTAVSKESLRLHLSIGLFPSRKAFPDWVLALPRTTLVPVGVWDNAQSGYSLVALPSLFDEEVVSGFLEFLIELSPLLNLYRNPEGPISSVSPCWDLFEKDQNLITHPLFASEFEKLYGNVGALNSVYGSAFNSFQAASSRQGFKSLCDKRPWLAAHDYKKVRGSLISGTKDRVLKLPLMKNLTGMRPVVPTDKNNPHCSCEILLDPILVERSDNGLHPFSPAGYAFEGSIGAYRLISEAQSFAAEKNLRIRWLDEQTTSSVPVLVSFTGRYVTCETQVMFQSLIAQGKSLFFPGGLPAYTEEFKSVSLGKAHSIQSTGIGDVACQTIGTAKVWFSKQPSSHVNWENLRDQIQQLSGASCS